MDQVNKTLYIPLYGKSYVSKKGLFLHDPKAEEIWAQEGFALKGKSRSKWLGYYMGMRSAVFDRWVEQAMAKLPDAAVLHLGCGLDSRVLRVKTGAHMWYDVDFPEVIRERKRYFEESEQYKMLASDIRDLRWLEDVEGSCAIVVMEGISMYLSGEERKGVVEALAARFDRVWLLMDCYTVLAAKVSKYKNPINDVGVTQVYGVDDPAELECGGMRFLQEHSMTPGDLIEQLQGLERTVFRKLYAGAIAEKMYRLYEYRR